MAVVYATLIIKGYYTFDQVPASQQNKVRDILAAMDLDENGNPL
ncbi:CD1375 family protein [Paenibacillus sepulcri]